MVRRKKTAGKAGSNTTPPGEKPAAPPKGKDIPNIDLRGLVMTDGQSVTCHADGTYSVANTPPAAEPDALPEAYPPAGATIFERILWVRKRAGYLKKDTKVQMGQGSYQAISHDKVTAYLRPKLNDAGIFTSITCDSFDDVETGASTKSGRKIVQHRAVYDVTFRCAAAPVTAAVEIQRGITEQVSTPRDGDLSLTIRQPAYADDYGDKAPGKAASYAMKYALLKMFLIETGEDDESRIDAEMDGGGQAARIIDDDKLLADFWAVADECFGDDAKERVQAMCKRRFHLETYGDIPADRFADAVRAMRMQAMRDSETNGETDDATETIKPSD